MAILVVCPACGGRLNAPSHLLGRMAKCPQCGQAVKVAPSKDAPAAPPRRPSASKQGSDDNPEEEQAAIAAGPSRRTPSRKPRTLPSDADTADVQIDVIGLDRSADQKASAPPAHSRVSYALGIPALILGIIALSLSWLPRIGLLGLPLSGLGLLLGIGGLVAAIMHRGRGLGIPIAGSSVSLVALALGVFWLFQGIDAAAKQAGLKDVMGAGQEPEQKNASPRKPPVEKEIKWVDASKDSVRQGDIRVQVGGVAVRNIRIKDVLGDETVSPSKNLTIQVFIDNMSKTRKVDFLGWSGATVNTLGLTDLLGGTGRNKAATEAITAPVRNAAILKDDVKNEYKRVSLELGAQIPGQINAATSVYPGKQIEDLLVFEPPIDNVKFLRLELPAGAFEGTGSLYLQIPKSMISR